MSAVLDPWRAVSAGAEFSADRRYRYLLWRVWATDQPLLGWIMLNPSVAGERVKDTDPTIQVVTGRARRAGYGGVLVGNLYAFIATDPTDMLAAVDPIGRDNEAAIATVATAVNDIVLAWGRHADTNRAWGVIERLRARTPPLRLLHLGVTRNGMPRHPLRVPVATPLIEWRP